MESALIRLAGVEKVNVDLLKGDIEIHPEKDFRIDPSKIAKLIEDSGVTLHEAAIVADGIITKNADGNTIFRVSDSNQEYRVIENPKLEEMRQQIGEGKQAVLTGVIYREKAKKERKKYKKGQGPPPEIEITEFRKKQEQETK